MALDENIYELRRQKLKQIEALGQPAYRSKYEFTHTIPQILAEYSPKTAEQLENPRVKVRVAGRIMAIRLMGKAGFAHLQQSGQRLQIYVKKDASEKPGLTCTSCSISVTTSASAATCFAPARANSLFTWRRLTFLSKDLLPLPAGKQVASTKQRRGSRKI